MQAIDMRLPSKRKWPQWLYLIVCCFRLNVPGPGAYDLRAAGKHMSESAPAYTFGSRPKGRKTDTAPAPNNYLLPQIVGHKHVNKSSAPQYTMVGRSKVGGFSEDLTKVMWLVNSNVMCNGSACLLVVKNWENWSAFDIWPLEVGTKYFIR